MTKIFNTTCPECYAEFELELPDAPRPAQPVSEAGDDAHQEGETAATRVVSAFGGRSRVAKALGIDRAAVYRWDYPKERRGCGGSVPTKHHKEILRVAKSRGITLSKADLVNV